jgi:hypothetical protein
MAHEPVFGVMKDGEAPDQLDRLLCMLTDYWQMAPEHGEIRLSRFLLSVLRELSAVPNEVIFLVRQQLAGDGRTYKPTLDELKRMCIAAMKVKPLLRDHFGLDVDHG